MPIPPNIFVQALIVLSSDTDLFSGQKTGALWDSMSGSFTSSRVSLVDSGPNTVLPALVTSSSVIEVRSSVSDAITPGVIAGSVFSSVPVVWQKELEAQYQELGNALSELRELEHEDEWHIEAPVYNVACHVASELVANGIPAPAVFTHGPKSIVFNWHDSNTNLYLTISGDHISALVSSPKKIERRIEFPKALLNEQKLLPAIKALRAGPSLASSAAR